VITVSEADRRIAGALAETGHERRRLIDAAGAVLRSPIRADRDQPPFDRATMDGIAVAYESWEGGRREFAVAGTQRAGDPRQTLNDPASCMEIMTGAPLPVGADCVIRIEDIDLSNGVAKAGDVRELAPGTFVHATGTDARAGDVVLEAGVRLTPPRIAIAAAFGAETLDVAKVPSVAVVSTGDELVEVGQEPEPHQIRLSNVYAIEAGLRMRGFVEVERCHLLDDPDALRTSLGDLLERFDVLVLTGGVSMGKFDYVPETLKALAVEPVFHKVAQRPGKPLWFGVAPSGKPVFGLPGNPVSAIVCFRRYVLRHLASKMGLVERTETAALAEPVTFRPDMTYFLPVKLTTSDTGVLEAYPLRTNTSGDFGTLGQSDGIIELAQGRDDYPAGFPATVYRWN
jgi:molybdopterin molybdotransferase